MKTPAASWFLGAALLAFATGAHALVPSPKAGNLNHLPKASASSVPTPIHIDQGGDTIASALPITSLPFTDSGTTAGYVDNYAPTCGFASGAPDVVYFISPSAVQAGDLTISLCGSSYDTEVYVYADVQGHVIGCNDDSCGLQSELTVSVAVGHTYYIVVDGYYNYSGAYTILVTGPGIGCYVPCLSGSLLEGEPVCADNYYDSFNGGCNSVPPVFSPLPLPAQGASETVCGTYGGFFYAGLSYRDTDWYQIVVPAPGNCVISWTVRGETDTLCGIINGNTGCPVTSFYAYAYGAKCTDLTASATVSAGTWWLWAGSLNFGTVAGPCGQNYNATLTSQCPVAVEPATWGSIKNKYR
ncbi:MAG: hypothetical protein U0167_02910 [bacterium]